MKLSREQAVYLAGIITRLRAELCDLKVQLQGYEREFDALVRGEPWPEVPETLGPFTCATIGALRKTTEAKVGDLVSAIDGATYSRVHNALSVLKRNGLVEPVDRGVWRARLVVSVES